MYVSEVRRLFVNLLLFDLQDDLKAISYIHTLTACVDCYRHDRSGQQNCSAREDEVRGQVKVCVSECVCECCGYFKYVFPCLYYRLLSCWILSSTPRTASSSSSPCAHTWWAILREYSINTESLH